MMSLEAVNSARKVCSDAIGERTFFVVDGSVPRRGTRMDNPHKRGTSAVRGFYLVHPLAMRCPERAHEHSMRK